MRTYFEMIHEMGIDELSEFLSGSKGWGCLMCSEYRKIPDGADLVDVLDAMREPCDNRCAEHCKEWLLRRVESEARPEWQSRMLQTFGGDANV